jgi:hypothetical protein
MSRTRFLRRRSPASRPRTARRHELTTKRRGELAELAFTLKAASLGFGVAKPYGDSERYDFILDARDPAEGCPTLRAVRRVANHNPSTTLCHSDPSRSKNEAEEPAVLAGHSQSLWRVQVKCSTQLLDGLYRVNAHRRTQGRAIPYRPSEIDFLVAYIIPEDTWYVIPVRALRATSLLFRRRRDPKPGLYDQYREAWRLLRPK